MLNDPNPPIVWIDLETTGLDVSRDTILEVGLVATNRDCEPWLTDPYEGEVEGQAVEPLNLVIRPASGLDITKLEPVVVEMHAKSGLLAEISSDNAVTTESAEKQVREWIRSLKAAAGTDLMMAGSTVGQFDRQFFRRAWPTAHLSFAYRNIDVSSIKELVRRWYGEDAIYDKGLKLHRALSDIEDSIAELLYYRTNYFVSPE